MTVNVAEPPVEPAPAPAGSTQPEIILEVAEEYHDVSAPGIKAQTRGNPRPTPVSQAAATTNGGDGDGDGGEGGGGDGGDASPVLDTEDVTVQAGGPAVSYTSSLTNATGTATAVTGKVSLSVPAAQVASWKRDSKVVVPTDEGGKATITYGPFAIAEDMDVSVEYEISLTAAAATGSVTGTTTVLDSTGKNLATDSFTITVTSGGGKATSETDDQKGTDDMTDSPTSSSSTGSTGTNESTSASPAGDTPATTQSSPATGSDAGTGTGTASTAETGVTNPGDDTPGPSAPMSNTAEEGDSSTPRSDLDTAANTEGGQGDPDADTDADADSSDTEDQPNPDEQLR